MQRTRHRRLALTATILAAGLTACDRGDSDRAKPPTSQNQGQDRVALPAQKPAYSFAAGLEEKRPEIVGFMRHFLETCLAGDYGAYRRLVARAADPESRSRFERVLNSLRSLAIESIEPVALQQLPPPVYLVVGKAELALDEKASHRRRSGTRHVAMLVFEEDGEWRTALAPAELQPGDEPATTTPAPTTTTSAPSYPWDEDGDY